MALRCGIVGLPNVGKSTLFNALTESQNAEASNYPFCTIEPNIGTIIVPDPKVDKLVEIYNPKKISPGTISFVDIAGLVKGASKGEGLGNQFLSHIREVEAIIHIVRCFQDENIIHVNNKIDPKEDIEIIETELILKDLDVIEKRLEKIEKSVRIGDKKFIRETELLHQLKDHFAAGRLAHYFVLDLSQEDRELLNEVHLLTDKPVIYVANVNEEDAKGNEYTKIVEEIANKEDAKCLVLSVKIESEIAALETMEEKREFLNDLGLKESGLNRLIRESYALLGLVTFYTAGEKEVHAWTIDKGLKAPQAAGKIHTDFEKGFIRAEVIKYDDLVELGSEAAVKEKGLMKVEGKDYIVEDGDVVFFRFNV
ncbi:MAG TPA: redox-regulated ATPase YchF [Ignavibacteria bacterium]|nr:redox-regulated ATPase YchF [Ignavibacteria bacterium]